MRAHGILSGAVLLMSGVVAAAATFPDVLLEASALIDDGQYTEAIEVLATFRDEDASPAEVADIQNIIGWAYFSDGRPREAEVALLNAFDRATELGTDEGLIVRIANNLGTLYFTEGDLESAEQFFSVALDAGSVSAARYQALIEIKREEMDAARHVRRGVSLRSERKFDEAVTEYDESLAVRPDDAVVLELKGYALFRSGKLEKALAALQSSYDIDPTRVTTSINLVKVYCSTGAEEDLESFIDDSLFSGEDIRNWWEIDRELHSVCMDSLVAARLVSDNL